MSEKPDSEIRVVTIGKLSPQEIEITDPDLLAEIEEYIKEKLSTLEIKNDLFKVNLENANISEVDIYIPISQAMKIDLNRSESSTNSTDLEVKIRTYLNQNNYEISSFWVLNYLVFTIARFIDERQREEWIGDLEEYISEMKKLKAAHLHINFQISYRTLMIVKSLIIFKIKTWFSYIKSRVSS